MTGPPKHPPSSRKEADEDTLEFEGVPGDNSDAVDRPHVVPASESAIGGIDHDERGQARWKWKADVSASADPNAETFNYLKALDTNLEIERSQRVRAFIEHSKETGINPYNTARTKKPK